jgi:hypothetical protein
LCNYIIHVDFILLELSKFGAIYNPSQAMGFARFCCAPEVCIADELGVDTADCLVELPGWAEALTPEDSAPEAPDLGKHISMLTSVIVTYSQK